jgi:hypothetical protein
MSEALQSSSHSVAQNCTEWAWTPKRRAAARALAAGLTQEQAAAKAGVSRRMLCYWLCRPQFRRRVDALIRRSDEACQRYAIAQRAKRIEAMNDRWQRGQRTIQARSAAYADSAVPGACEGLLARHVKVTGGGETGRTIETLETDRALLQEMRELEKAAAEEMGHRKGATESHSGPAVQVIVAPQFVCRGPDGRKWIADRDWTPIRPADAPQNAQDAPGLAPCEIIDQPPAGLLGPRGSS